MQIVKNTDNHPCFNKESKGSCGRVHLPVAPKCNIKCNYCNRKYDCVNESRPGVTSGVLTPPQALAYMEKVLEAEPRITVAGIAGPGDPMANPVETLETMRLLKERYPQLLFCLSSNGLNMPPYLDELAELGVTHITVTMNAVDPEVGEKIYGWAREGKVVYRGRQAAERLIERQLESIRGAKERGMMVKVNTIIIPGVNDAHIPEVTRAVAELGADIQNLLPLCPTADTMFSDLPEPSAEMVKALRAEAGAHITQMTHCKRCRADAVGLLDKDRSAELCGTLQACSKLTSAPEVDRPYVAVASREGMLVNQHLGEAASFEIWARRNGGYVKIDEREAPSRGCGPDRWKQLAAVLKDCRILLVAAFGEHPRQVLTGLGITPVAANGFIESAVAAAFGDGDLSVLRGRRPEVAGSGCGGNGCGC
ncbi:nitrogenase cofactor biosynthesis protein NifB [Desulfovibrio psychrotolerans]|uniref:FeMo cofactor biosynthesis protein NifB n=1 Tax=Desulfovibrio psychrotolerans TaxID=415242 RepID=A0A7J0BR14_9BACT|nr:nitrogenase cofactor biosynthesis protein NifB [Desulfovibrio psychrotolerans]GFM36110.1 nitrogenase cofactor biosynthesis protein NifB [Desulfovibrio psychrotolerans]